MQEAYNWRTILETMIDGVKKKIIIPVRIPGETQIRYVHFEQMTEALSAFCLAPEIALMQLEAQLLHEDAKWN